MHPTISSSLGELAGKEGPQEVEVALSTQGTLKLRVEVSLPDQKRSDLAKTTGAYAHDGDADAAANGAAGGDRQLVRQRV